MARKIKLPKPYRPPQTPAEERKFGAIHGSKAARENRAKYGCVMVEQGAQDLALSALERGATPYDRAYAKAYIGTARRAGCRLQGNPFNKAMKLRR